MDWITQLIRSALDKFILNPIGAIRAIVDSVDGAWTIATNIWRAVRGVEQQALDQLRHLKSAAMVWAALLASAIRQIILVRIPHAIDLAVTRALKAAQTLINEARSFASQLYHLALTYADKVVAFLRNEYNTFVKWVQGKIAALVNLLSWAAHIVATLLTNPFALVTWFWGALLVYARQQAIARAPALARLALHVAVRSTVRLGGFIDHLIASIL